MMPTNSTPAATFIPLRIRYAVLWRFGQSSPFFCRALDDLREGDALILTDGMAERLAEFLAGESTDATIRARMVDGQVLEFNGETMPHPGELRRH